MLSLLCFIVIAALSVLAVTRHRIFVICGFYSFYALFTVLDQENVPHLGPVTIYRALYLIIFTSLFARLVQDRSFLLRTRRWPLASYFFLLVLILASSLYSQTSGTFYSSDSPTVWDIIAVFSLFWMAASQVQREVDLKIMAGTTVGVSLVVSAWVIWNAAQLNFVATRGGTGVNENYVSQFVLAGAISLANVILVGKRLVVKLLCLPPLLCLLSGSLILASRGYLAAFFVGLIWMAATAHRGQSHRTLIGAVAALVLLFGVALLLPGSSSLFARFQETTLGTLNERTILWSQSIKHFNESGLTRMVFGQGLSSATFVLSPVSTLLNYHNQYLKYLMEQGLIGLFAFLLFLYAIVRRVTRSHHPLKHVMLGWLGFLIVTGLSGTIADSHQFWILLGVMAGVCVLPDASGNGLQPAVTALNPGPSTSPFPRAF